MRIGIDARMYGAQSTSGIGVYIEKLMENIFQQDLKNEYFLFMLEPAFSQFTPPRPNIKKIKVDCHWYSFAEQIQLPKVLKKYKLDLVHFPHFNVPILYRGKYFVTIHDITPKFFPGPKIKKLFFRKLAYELVFRWGLKRAQKIITISQHTKNNLTKYFKIQPEKISVIYLGVDETFARSKPEAIENFKKQYGIKKPFLAFIGVWRDHKNLPGLIAAFNQLKQKNQFNGQLVLAGKSDTRYPEIFDAIKKSPFQEDIITPGFIEKNDLAAFYSAAKVFVVPSFCEGFGLIALEAAACQTPVAASNTTSLPEIMQEAALYFEPNNPSQMAFIINQILNQPNIHENLVTAGLNLVKKYSWQNCAKKTLEIYQSVL